MTKEEIQKIIVEKLNEYKFELPKDEYELVAEELAEMIVKNCSIPDVVNRRELLVCDTCMGRGLLAFEEENMICSNCFGTGKAN